MAEVQRGEDMGKVTQVDVPPGTSTLAFGFVLMDEGIPVPTELLTDKKGSRPEVGDFFMAGVNYLASTVAEVEPNVKRYVNNVGDI